MYRVKGSMAPGKRSGSLEGGAELLHKAWKAMLGA